MWSQGLSYQRELDGGFVADGELVVARCDASGLLQQADPAFDPVSLLVHLAVESGRSASRRAPVEAVFGLVTLLRDGVRDLSATQVVADGAGGVRAVGEDVVGPGAWMSAARPGNTDAVYDLGERRGVAALSGGNDSGQDLEGSVDREMDLCGQAATRPADRVVGRLGLQPARSRPARTGSPFLRAPAACWWARQTVESTDTSHSTCPVASALTCNFFKTIDHVPSICQRRNSVYAVSHGPYRSGTSRQGALVLARHQIPSKHCRRRRGFRPILGNVGNTASSRVHCWPVRSPRAFP